jgi:NAD(P)-dependent dehydrogenase (short-subunit alcohol dehydrogenase family)
MSQAELKDRVVIVTGASSGVGASTALALARRGARVTAVARSRERMEELFGGVAIDIEHGNVGSLEDMERVTQATIERHGRCDAVIANAGIGEYADFLDMTAETVREIVDTNLMGTIWSIRAALPHMLDRGQGDVVVVSSVVALMDSAGEAVYAATKAAQKSLAGCLDLEVRERGIRVTTLCPGGIKTGFAIGRGREAESEELDTMLHPDDVAAAILTVLSQPPGVRTTLWGMSSMQEE